jgi:hypothetical protein
MAPTISQMMSSTDPIRVATSGGTFARGAVNGLSQSATPSTAKPVAGYMPAKGHLGQTDHEQSE